MQIFNSLQEASDKENISTKKLKRLVTTNENLNGVIYSKSDNPIIKNVEYKRNAANIKPVNKIDTSGNIIMAYKSLGEASVCEKIPHATLCRMMKNRTTKNDFYYEYNIN